MLPTKRLILQVCPRLPKTATININLDGQSCVRCEIHVSNSNVHLQPNRVSHINPHNFVIAFVTVPLLVVSPGDSSCPEYVYVYNTSWFKTLLRSSSTNHHYEIIHKTREWTRTTAPWHCQPDTRTNGQDPCVCPVQCSIDRSRISETSPSSRFTSAVAEAKSIFRYNNETTMSSGQPWTRLMTSWFCTTNYCWNTTTIYVKYSTVLGYEWKIQVNNK